MRSTITKANFVTLRRLSVFKDPTSAELKGKLKKSEDNAPK